MSRPQKHPREVFLAIATIQISEKFQENVLTLRLKRSFTFGGFCRFLGSLETQNFIIYGRDNSIDKEAAVPRCPSKLMFLKIFAIFTGKHLCWSLFLISFRSVHTGKVGSRTLWSDPGPGTLM